MAAQIEQDESGRRAHPRGDSPDPWMPRVQREAVHDHHGDIARAVDRRQMLGLHDHAIIGLQAPPEAMTVPLCGARPGWPSHALSCQLVGPGSAALRVRVAYPAGGGRMGSTILLLTNALRPSAEILPALGLLLHDVRVAPAEAAALLDAPVCDAVLVDARGTWATPAG